MKKIKILTRVDSDGHITLELDSILDFNKYDTSCGAKDKYMQK